MKKLLTTVILLLLALPAAWSQSSTQGRDFWVMFLRNYDGGNTVSLFAAGDTACSINVSIPLAGWSQTYTLPASGYVSIALPQGYANPGTATGLMNKGIHVTSTHNISLYASNYMDYSFDITTVLPTPSLRNHYITQDYPSIGGTSNNRDEIGFVATRDNTVVTVQLSTATTAGHSSGSTQSFTLMAGQSYMLTSYGGGSFSGTELTSNAPLAVFQGNEACNVPQGYSAADHLYEQAIPTDYWGKEFVLVPLAQRTGAGDRVRVTSSAAGCEVYLDGVYLTTLAAKATHEFNLSYGTAHRLITTEPSTVCLYLSGGNYGGQPGDPSAVVIPPVEQGVYSVVFNAYATSQISYHYANVICRTEHVSSMRLDGTDISAQFTALDTALSYAVVSVTAGTHTMSNNEGTFSAFFYGLGSWESYAYIAGMGLRNLRSTMLADSVDVQTLPGGVTTCLHNTVQFAIQTTGSVDTATWYIDGIRQQTNALQCQHQFDSLGDFEVMALLRGQYDTSWIDTMRTVVHVIQPHSADQYVTQCDTAYHYRDTAYAVSGDYELLKAAADGDICDSLFTLHLTINQSSVSTIADTVVENMLPLTWNGLTFTGDTVYRLLSLTNAVGCDSGINYMLKVYWNVTTDLDTTVCINNLPVTRNGLTFTEAGTLYDTMLTVHGADSVVGVTLHLAPTWNDTVDAVICDSVWDAATGAWQGVGYAFEDSIYSLQGIYDKALLTAEHGCDSIRVLQLTVNQATTADTAVDVCDLFTWHDSTYTLSTTSPAHTTANTAGCDSVTTLLLTVRHSSASAISDTVVENLLPHTFNDIAFADSTTDAVVTVVNAVGCDSAITYSLFVHWNVDTTLFDTVCNNALPVVWNGKTFGLGVDGDTLSLLNQSAVTLTDTALYLNHFGADSLVTMHLTVHPLYDHHLDTAICDNQQLLFGDSLFVPVSAATHNLASTLVEHTDSLISAEGCDSLSTLHLTVKPTFDHHLLDTVCTNQSYTWGTPERTMFQTESVTFNLHGTDSLAAYGIADATLPQDTVWTDSLLTVGGCDSLSSLHLHLLAAYNLHFADTMCDAHLVGLADDSSAVWSTHSYHFSGQTFDTTDNYTLAFTSTEGCDSLRTLHLTVFPTYDQHTYDTIYDGDLSVFESTTYDTTGTYPYLLAATFACDSLRTMHLQRWPRTYIDTVVCQNSLPHTWNGVVFADGQGMHTAGGMQIIKDSVHLTQGVNGGDSLVVMTLVVRDTSMSVDVVQVCDSLIWHHTPDTVYRATTAYPHIVLQQTSAFDTAGLAAQQRGGRYQPFEVHLAPFAVQCDSVHRLDLTVHYTHYATDYRIACDSTEWPTNSNSPSETHRYYRDTVGIAGPLGSFAISGPVDTLVTTGGCDSVVALSLVIRHATYECAIDTFCWHEIYHWRGQEAGDTAAEHVYTTDHFYLDELLQTHRFVHPDAPSVATTCDSVMAIRLTQMARPHLTLTDSIDCTDLSYLLTMCTDMPYMRWIDGTSGTTAEWTTVIEARPTETTTYTATVDYRQLPLCPLSESLTLRPVVVPTAVMKVNPATLSYEHTEFDAYDISVEAPGSIHPSDPEQWSRSWFVDWLMQDEQSWHLHHNALPDHDTLALALRVYNGQCYDTTVTLIPIQRIALFAPNIFTPLLEGNSRFVVVGQGVVEGELYVYDRDGMLVSHLTDYTEGWDGRDASGAVCRQGSYVWKLVYRTVDYPTRRRTEVGTVILAR